MKSRRTVEETVELPEGLNLEGVDINGEVYNLSIENSRDGVLALKFSKGNHVEYTIQIGEEGITFNRHVYRPNHDHDDTESLQRFIGRDNDLQEEGKISWMARFPSPREGYDFFRVPFGPTKVDY